MRLCWTAGCDAEAEWDLALYNRWPNNETAAMPVKARCRPHTSDIRDWWINRHDGKYVMLTTAEKYTERYL